MIKRERIRKHLELIFRDLGFDPNDPSTKDTPKRIANMWCNELCRDVDHRYIHCLEEDMTFFDNVEGSDRPITMTMPFNSWCEHHFLPFFGEIKVTYVPNKKIIGLSKIPRIVEYFSQRPQLQERLGMSIANYLFDVAEARGVKVEIYNTTHTCVSCRGIQYNADTRTEYIKGVI